MFWKPVSPVGVLKVGGLDVGSKPFTSQGEARSWGSLPFVWCRVSPGVCVSAFPTPFYEGFFFASVGVTQLVSGSLSEAIFPPVVVHSMCSWEEGSSRAFCHHLGQLLLVYLKVTYLNGT